MDAWLLNHVQLFATPWNLPGSLVHGDSPGKNTGVGCHSDVPNPGIKPKSPALWADYLPPEPSGKPKNTGMSSLSLLQGNFPIQERNLGSSVLQEGSLPAELCRKFDITDKIFVQNKNSNNVLDHICLHVYIYIHMLMYTYP